jgi:DNA-binding IclR family transcriptional regulator
MLQSQSLRSRSKPTPRDLIGSVQRSLAILELLANSSQGLSAKQVSQNARLNLSTCYHLLNTLIVSGYAVKDPDNLCYRLSSKIGFLPQGRCTPAYLVCQLTPHVQSLQDATLETAYLSVWDGAEIVLSAIVESPLSVRVKALDIGKSDANHASALGKAVLAYLTDEQVDDYLVRHDCAAYTPFTLTDPPAIRACLAEVRAQGYSLDQEEFLPDVYCIGAPIFDVESRILASIAISMPGHRYHAHKGAFLSQVKDAARAATRNMLILGCAGLSRPL